MLPEEHFCPENRFATPGIRVLYGPSVEEGWKNWILEVARIAGEKDVIDGEAERVGEMMYQSQFVIFFCPFCGLLLDTAPTVSPLSE